MNRLTNLDLAILRTSPGKSDTFIYTVPKVNKVKAYCKQGSNYNWNSWLYKKL